MCLCLSFLSVAAIKRTEKINLGVKGFILAHRSRLPSIKKGNQGPRNLEWSHDIHSAEHSNEEMHTCMPVLSSLCFDRAQDPLPREWSHSQWVDLPSSTNGVKMITYTCAHKSV